MSLFRFRIQGRHDPIEIDAQGFNAAASKILSDPDGYCLRRDETGSLVEAERVVSGKKRYWKLVYASYFNMYPLSEKGAERMRRAPA